MRGVGGGEGHSPARDEVCHSTVLSQGAGVIDGCSHQHRLQMLFELCIKGNEVLPSRERGGWPVLPLFSHTDLHDYYVKTVSKPLGRN